MIKRIFKLLLLLAVFSTSSSFAHEHLNGVILEFLAWSGKDASCSNEDTVASFKRVHRKSLSKRSHVISIDGFNENWRTNFIDAISNMKPDGYIHISAHGQTDKLALGRESNESSDNSTEKWVTRWDVDIEELATLIAAGAEAGKHERVNVELSVCNGGLPNYVADELRWENSIAERLYQALRRYPIQPAVAGAMGLVSTHEDDSYDLRVEVAGESELHTSPGAFILLMDPRRPAPPADMLGVYKVISKKKSFEARVVSRLMKLLTLDVDSSTVPQPSDLLRGSTQYSAAASGF